VGAVGDPAASNGVRHGGRRRTRVDPWRPEVALGDQPPQARAMPLERRPGPTTASLTCSEEARCSTDSPQYSSPAPTSSRSGSRSDTRSPRRARGTRHHRQRGAALGAHTNRPGQQGRLVPRRVRAFVALCTPDNRLADGTIECRQNVVVEIQRAFDRPRVRHKVQVIKAPMCVLPSDINPTYDRLDVDDVAPRLMQSWPSFGLGAFLRASRIRGRSSAARRWRSPGR
jgi:hypothetical protein